MGNKEKTRPAVVFSKTCLNPGAETVVSSRPFFLLDARLESAHPVIIFHLILFVVLHRP